MTTNTKDRAIISACDVLCSYMTANQISQRELANMLGKTQAYISKLLDRQFFMSVSTAKRIEKATGLSARTLLMLDIDYRLTTSK